MKNLFTLALPLIFSCTLIFAEDFTVSTYNCGGLTHHYDYLRGISMQKVMQERYNVESENMALNDKIQQVALKILFSNNPEEKATAENEWNQKNYNNLFEKLTSIPSEPNSPNTIWNQRIDQVITNYQIRPVVIHDKEVKTMLDDYLIEMTHGKKAAQNILLNETRAKMAQRIFANQLKYDIICLQEADYLNASLFPENYEVLFGGNSHSVNGIAWNKEKFDLVEAFGDFMGRAYIAKLQNKQDGKTILVATGHLSGCNPYRVEINSATGCPDSQKGDKELQEIVNFFNGADADFKVIGMDSNVTSLHPRLNILKEANFHMDYENFLEPTCTNPYQALNTRIDWIVVKEGSTLVNSIVNVPVLGVCLNSMQTNISDHKPVAAKISY
jgi:hypothetical protein